MKLLFVALLYYIEAFLFDGGMFFVMKMTPNSYITAFFSRSLEKVGERMLKHEAYIKKIIEH